MIYITEQNLRDLYAKQAFESFTLVEGERLTPGARQFLADRQISVVDPTEVKPYKTASIQIDGSSTRQKKQRLRWFQRRTLYAILRLHLRRLLLLTMEGRLAAKSFKVVFARLRHCI